MEKLEKEIDLRVKAFQKELQETGVDGALIVQKCDLFYFSQTAQNAFLFVPANDEPILMVKKNFKRAQNEAKITNIVQIKSIKEVFQKISSIIKKGKIGLELDVLPTKQYFMYNNLLPSLEMVDVSNIIKKIRMIKSEFEISLFKEGAKLATLMFNYVKEILKENVSEIELAAEIEKFLRQKGHQGAVRVRGFNQELFYGHIISGSNSAYLSFFEGVTGGVGLNPSYPQGASFKKIKKNEPVLVDYTTVYNGYIIDQTRIFSIGNINSKLDEAHKIAIEIKKELQKFIKIGTNGKDAFDLAYEIAKSYNLEKNFMGYKENQVSFVGHGVGLELDEFPILAKSFDFPLEENMVFALEPKFLFPDEGTVGIEDTFCLTQNGLVQLTNFGNEINVL